MASACLESCNISSCVVKDIIADEAYNDVDVLIVLSVPHEELTELTSALRSAFMIAERDLALQFDLLFLTPEEFSSRPLRDMDQLVLLYQGAARV